MASRLSENENFRVLLLEAGRDESIFSETPLFATLLKDNDDFIWKYPFLPQTNAFRGKHLYNNGVMN